MWQAIARITATHTHTHRGQLTPTNPFHSFVQIPVTSMPILLTVTRPIICLHAIPNLTSTVRMRNFISDLHPLIFFIPCIVDNQFTTLRPTNCAILFPLPTRLPLLRINCLIARRRPCFSTPRRLLRTLNVPLYKHETWSPLFSKLDHSPLTRRPVTLRAEHVVLIPTDDNVKVFALTACGRLSE
jgi:hypothetical protein